MATVVLSHKVYFCGRLLDADEKNNTTVHIRLPLSVHLILTSRFDVEGVVDLVLLPVALLPYFRFFEDDAKSGIVCTDFRHAVPTRIIEQVIDYVGWKTRTPGYGPVNLAFGSFAELDRLYFYSGIFGDLLTAEVGKLLAARIAETHVRDLAKELDSIEFRSIRLGSFRWRDPAWTALALVKLTQALLITPSLEIEGRDLLRMLPLLPDKAGMEELMEKTGLAAFRRDVLPAFEKRCRLLRGCNDPWLPGYELPEE